MQCASFRSSSSSSTHAHLGICMPRTLHTTSPHPALSFSPLAVSLVLWSRDARSSVCALVCVHVVLRLWLCQPPVTHAAVCGSSWSRVTTLPSSCSTHLLLHHFAIVLVAVQVLAAAPFTVYFWCLNCILLCRLQQQSKKKRLFFAFATYVGQAPLPHHSLSTTHTPATAPPSPLPALAP